MAFGGWGKEMEIKSLCETQTYSGYKQASGKLVLEGNVSMDILEKKLWWKIFGGIIFGRNAIFIILEPPCFSKI